MFVKSALLFAIAVTGLVSAQNDLCSEPENTVNSAGDIEKLADCETLDGNLIVGEEVSSLSLLSLKQIKGDFIVDGAANLAGIDFPVLNSINGQFKLHKLTTLSSLSCPSLTKVGSIDWVTLPELRTLTFTKKITECNSVKISDTQLNSLDGIDLRTAERFMIDNNKYLKNVTVGLRNVSEVLSLEFNSKTVTISFPELVWCNNMTLLDVGSISLPKLKTVKSSINFVNNSVTSIECKSLTTIEQSLAFVGNTKLTKLNFPVLEEIGGAFKIHNNSQLVTIDGFPKLKTVRGAIDFVGNFNNATLPSLEDVQGGFNLQTTEKFDCTEFDSYNSEKVIKGDDFVCKGEQETPETKDGKAGADGKGSGDDKEGAAGHFAAGSLLSLSMVVILGVSL